MIGRLIRWTIGGLVITTIGSMVAALVTKGRTPSVGEPESDDIALVTIFDGLEFASTAKAFRGGSVLCWYGGGDLDLRGATLDPAGATLTVKLLFGGGRVLVPDEWNVEMHVTPILGGVADTREARDRAADAQRLVIDGYAAFGGFAVDSSRPEAVLDLPAMAGSAAEAVSDATDDAADAVTELVPALDV